MADLLAIAQIQDSPTSTKFLHTLEATHRELAFLLEDVGLGKAHLKDPPPGMNNTLLSRGLGTCQPYLVGCVLCTFTASH